MTPLRSFNFLVAALALAVLAALTLTTTTIVIRHNNHLLSITSWVAVNSCS